MEKHMVLIKSLILVAEEKNERYFINLLKNALFELADTLEFVSTRATFLFC